VLKAWVFLIAVLAFGSMNANELEMKDEVTKQLEAYDAALKDRDENKLGQLFDDDGRFINDEGRALDKKGYIADFVKDKTYESASSTDVTTRVVGNMVIQTGIWTAKGTKQGKAFQKKVRYTTVWIKNGDTWVVTAEQSTPIRG
jgi:ketosteroid isomerase-like protein